MLRVNKDKIRGLGSVFCTYTLMYFHNGRIKISQHKTKCETEKAEVVRSKGQCLETSGCNFLWNFLNI